jgi:hypothetical protein
MFFFSWVPELFPASAISFLQQEFKTTEPQRLPIELAKQLTGPASYTSALTL